MALLLSLCLSNISYTPQEIPQADSAIPNALWNDCTWERKVDYSKPLPRMLSQQFTRVTEETCIEKCSESVICNYANYNTYTRECDLVPRRPFHTSFLTGFRRRKDKWVMNAKVCPVDNYLKRHDDPEELVMCRMERKERVLDEDYIFQYSRWGIEDRDEAEYWCRTDPLCKGISYTTDGYNNYYWLFYYKIIDLNGPAPVKTGSRMTDKDRAELVLVSIKNCQPTACACLFTSYKNKVLTGKPFETIKRPNYLSIYECEQRCEGNLLCYGAVATEGSWRRGGRECMLYNQTSAGDMIPYDRRRRYSRTFLKNHC
ncbi:uncharacterized protein LOC135496776 [Lineus longissimus]|uniref:uncharacterized protein LOC135496776 n=1 Tax=Lineus longissimus TaxID=88925 RepID=UPI002B4D35DA